MILVEKDTSVSTYWWNFGFWNVQRQQRFIAKPYAQYFQMKMWTDIWFKTKLSVFTPRLNPVYDQIESVSFLGQQNMGSGTKWIKKYK